MTVSGRPVAGLRARRLLASLALADGRPRSATRLIDDIWEDDPPRSPQQALQTQISRLRPLLGGGSIEGVGTAYRLTGVESDLAQAQRLVAGGGNANIAEATTLWRGAPGDDLGAESPVARDLRRAATAVRRRLDDALAAAALNDGDFGLAREIAENRCAEDPLDESAHVLAMRALAGEGRRADALAVFARLRRRLAKDLGVEPGAEAAALHAELIDDSIETVRAPRRPRSVGLRAEATPLIGRDDDLAALLRAIEDHRVVTILGPGGVGKTRIANAVGNALADRGLPVFLVELASVRNGADVISALAQALDVGEADLSAPGLPRLAVGDLDARLVDGLRGRASVLILDNCEHVVDASARVVADLIAAEPLLRVVTTSRAPLQIAAEQVHPLPRLRVDGADSPAIELFRVRARGVRPDLELPEGEVTALCRRLDGLPLAIELAAARTRTMSVEEVGRRLAERLDVLRSSDRTAPDRHRTLHAVIEWSWDLLEDDSRDALRRLCRFPAGFSAAAAATVLRSGPIDDALEALDALVNQSLLGFSEDGGQPRYRMLEMVREFGEEQLGAAARTEVDTAMAGWARDFAADVHRRFESGLDRTLITIVATELENLVWVLRRSLAGDPATVVTVFPLIAGFWAMRGMHAEVRAWTEPILRALPAPPADPDDQTREKWQWTLLLVIGHSIPDRALRSIALGRSLVRVLHRPALRFNLAAELLSSLLLSQTVTDSVRTALRATSSLNPEVRQIALGLRLTLRENAGNLHGALADGDALHATMNPNDPWLTATLAVRTGSVYSQQGRWGEAVDYYRTGVTSLASIGADEDEQQARGFLIASLLAVGRLEEAERELTILADGWRPGDGDPQGYPEVAAGMLVGFAELARARGRSGTALYAQAGRLLVDQHPMVARDPGALMVLSVIVTGLSLGGDWAHARSIVDLVRDGLRDMFSPAGWHDVPQAATLAMATGLLLSTDPAEDDDSRRTGATLMLLGKRLDARRDYRTLDEVYQRSRSYSALTEAQWREIADRVASMSRRNAVDEFCRLVIDRQ